MEIIKRYNSKGNQSFELSRRNGHTITFPPFEVGPANWPNNFNIFNFLANGDEGMRSRRGRRKRYWTGQPKNSSTHSSNHSIYSVKHSSLTFVIDIIHQQAARQLSSSQDIKLLTIECWLKNQKYTSYTIFYYLFLFVLWVFIFFNFHVVTKPP